MASDQEIAGIAAPTLLIHGRDDRVVHYENGLKLCALIPMVIVFGYIYRDQLDLTAPVSRWALLVVSTLLGAILFFFLPPFVSSTLRQAVANDHIDFLVANEVGIVVQILVGVGLMALMIFRPQGLIGDKSEVAVSVRR